MQTQAVMSRYRAPRSYLETQMNDLDGDLLAPQTTQMFNQTGFDDLISAYKGSGGTARADDLALLLAEKGKGSFVSLAKSIVKGDVFSIEWNNHFWLPMFQFEPCDMTMKRSVRKILRELRHVLDTWALAAWFAEPNAWLKNRRPVDMLDANFPAVFAAARADRFVAAG